MDDTGPGGDRLSLLPVRTRLPRGRTALPQAEVATSHRGRILQGCVDEVADRGYQTCTVAHIIRRARVSRGAFYAHFVDKQDAFAEAHLAASQQLLDLVTDNVRRAEDDRWRTRHRVGVLAYLHGLADAPAYAVSFMVELPSAGPRLLDQRATVMDRYTQRTMTIADEAAREHGHTPPSPLAILGITAAADELVTRQIRANAGATLPDLLGPILEIQLPVIGGCTWVHPASSEGRGLRC